MHRVGVECRKLGLVSLHVLRCHFGRDVSSVPGPGGGIPSLWKPYRKVKRREKVV